MSAIAIIPARYGSSRLPGKPLAMLGGKPLVKWAYDTARMCFDRVVVATDDSRIVDAVEGFGGECVLTSVSHTSGTSRVAEAFSIIGADADIVVNLQGDEPFLDPRNISTLLHGFDDPKVSIATLMMRDDNVDDPNVVKVVIDHNHDALYFSRALIPYPQAHSYPYLRHIGIYAFRAQTLRALVSLPPTALDAAESLEQLRWLYHGYKIRCLEVESTSIGIDTPDDLEKANLMIKL